MPRAPRPSPPGLQALHARPVLPVTFPASSPNPRDLHTTLARPSPSTTARQRATCAWLTAIGALLLGCAPAPSPAPSSAPSAIPTPPTVELRPAPSSASLTSSATRDIPTPVVPTVPAIDWRPALETALDESRRTGRPVVLFFHADWSPSSRVVESTVWNDPRVRRALLEFVVVDVDVTRASPATHDELALRYQFDEVPAAVVLESTDAIKWTSHGTITQHMLLGALGATAP